jgi:ribose transport system ATP-binding protein
MNDTPPIVLEAQHITKRFPGVLALDDVEFRIYAGTVHALIGENGAGKSTLMNILSGVYPDYEGVLLLNDQPVRFRNTSDAQQAGVALIHQELNPVKHLSIAENIFLGREPLNRLGLIDYKRMHAEAAALLLQLGFSENTRTLMGELKVGQQQLVEIAKALSLRARILIMDEPTSSLTEREIDALFRLIRSLIAQGTAIVYITHKMDELPQIASRATVFRDGKFIAERPIAETTTDQWVNLMVGRDANDFFVKQTHPAGKTLLRVSNLSLRNPENPARPLLRNVSFSLASSEVLGLYGLMGAGRTELLETLFGLYAPYADGDIRIEAEKISLRHPSDAIRHGLALIPEDRKTGGLVLDMNIARNISLASLAQFLSNGLLSRKKEHRQADLYRQRLQIKSHSSAQLAKQLSGGNQQKVVLAKGLHTQPRILLLDEPTRGIDVGAKNEIYKLIDELAAQGMAILVASSELPEMMAISDRILTLCEGQPTGIFLRNEFSEEAILKASLPIKNNIKN